MPATLQHVVLKSAHDYRCMTCSTIHMRSTMQTKNTGHMCQGLPRCIALGCCADSKHDCCLFSRRFLLLLNVVLQVLVRAAVPLHSSVCTVAN
jgi:hypothetical protein